MIIQAIPPQIMGDPQLTHLLTSKTRKEKLSLLPRGGGGADSNNKGLHVQITAFCSTNYIRLLGFIKIFAHPLKIFRGCCSVQACVSMIVQGLVLGKRLVLKVCSVEN